MQKYFFFYFKNSQTHKKGWHVFDTTAGRTDIVCLSPSVSIPPEVHVASHERSCAADQACSSWAGGRVFFNGDVWWKMIRKSCARLLSRQQVKVWTLPLVHASFPRSGAGGPTGPSEWRPSSSERRASHRRGLCWWRLCRRRRRRRRFKARQIHLYSAFHTQGKAVCFKSIFLNTKNTDSLKRQLKMHK